MAKSRQHGIKKFIGVLSVLIIYTLYAIHSYGLQDGLSVSSLTWAFFIFATPIADAGFLIAFPVRLITGFKMFYTQIIIWVFGALVVAWYLVSNKEVFQKTPLLELFYNILANPWPLWLILAFSGVGTYLTIKLDDELVDVAVSKNKKSLFAKKRSKLILTTGVFIFTLSLYFVLLKITNTQIKVI